MPDHRTQTSCHRVTGERCRDTFALKTLIVDDDALVREVMCMQLEALGVETEAASTRTEAIELLRDTTFDLVFLDTQIPDLAESDVLAEIPFIGGRTALVVMSGLPRVAPPGAIFLMKPLAITDIRAAVNSAHERAFAAACRC